MSEQSAVETARRLVDRLLELRVAEAVLSPGSRSGPLALAFHAADRQSLIRLHVRVDEREAAFLALGMAKASRRPVPVVTTSGTAVANLHPALLEAKHARVPLIAVTADRPAHLHGTGANQTTDDPFFLPGVEMLAAVDELVGGPAHLNLAFDEPLVEVVDWRFGQRSEGEWRVGPGATVDLDPGSRTVVVAGDSAGPEARQLAETARWPLLAEPSSGARTGSALACHRLLIGHFAGRIERVVSLGHSTLSRPVTRLLSRDDIDIVHVGTQSSFPVPAGPRVTFVDEVRVTGADDPRWCQEWVRADAAVGAAVAAELDGSTPLDVARSVAAALPPGGLLFVGASNPIRDLDLAAAPFAVGEHRLVLANRGLAGIDGTLSSAIGAALARESTRALAYVGDLTFLHGSNGLLIGPDEPRPDLTIVVASDDGGSIFASLEQGAPEYADAFERVWGTPTGADLGALCSAFGVRHERVKPADLAAALDRPPTGIEVLEVPLDRTSRRDLDARIREAAERALA